VGGRSTAETDVVKAFLRAERDGLLDLGAPSRLASPHPLLRLAYQS
jgi:hypothetical protein